MVIAITPKQTFDHILKCDSNEPPEKQTRWKLRALTLDEQASVRDATLRADRATQQFAVNSGRVELMRLRWGLMGVENFVDSAGSPVKFEKVDGLVPDEFLARISAEHRAELSIAIANLGEVTAAEGN